MTTDKRARIVARCNKCGYQMCANEVWLSDDKKDEKLYCFSCAPDSAIRQIDLMTRGTAILTAETVS